MDIVCVGDNIEYEAGSFEQGVITNIFERKNYISRKAPRIKGATFRGERLEQIIASNIDNLIIVSSFGQPIFNNKVIDRFLVVAESSNVTPIILINKADLDEENELNYWVKLYKNLGYQTLKTSTETNLNISKIKKLIQGKTSIFWGQSGVGKSSILNSLFPGLDLKIGEVSDYNNKGRHTTVSVRMLTLEDNTGTTLIDTPGIREIDPYGIKKEDLGHYFPEFYEYSSNCRFNTCTHNHEPGCMVEKAVEDGKISPYRFESYLSILNTIEDDLFF